MTQTKAELLQTRHQGDIRLGDADSTHYVGFKAPATVGTSLVWTLPAADGTANYLLKTDGSGNLGWVADSSTDSTKMPLAGGIFTGDVTFDGATAGRDIVFDRSDNALEFADNAKATFGDEADLLIYHQGSSSYIEENGSGSLKITTNGTGVDIQKGSTETMGRFVVDGAVELYNNNIKRLETTTSGISVENTSGDPKLLVTGSGHAELTLTTTSNSDHCSVNFGDSDDHDIGEIRYTNSSNSMAFDVNATNALTLDSSQNATFAGAINTSDNKNINIGNGGDLKFRSNGSKGIVEGSISQVATAVSALDLNLNTSNYFTKTISGNSTFTFSNPAPSGTSTAFTLELTHSSGTVTWPSEVKWNADTAPTLTTGKTHLFMFVTDDGGSRYRGSALVDYVN